MANSLSAFKAELWSDTIVQAIVPQVVGLNFTSSIYEGTVDKVGGVVYVHTFGDVTVSDYTPGTDLTIDTLSGTKEALNISTAKYFNFRIDDIEESQSNIDLMNGFVGKAANALAQVVDTAILSTTGHADNAIAATAITTSNVDSILMQASENLDNKNVPRGRRWMVVSPHVASVLAQASLYVQGSLLGDYVVSTASFPGTPTTASEIPSYLGTARGFDIYLSSNLTKVSGDPRMLYGADAPIYFASAVPAGNLEVIRSERQFATLCRGLLLYGKLVPAESSKALGTIISDETA